jgi:hypothetical protein
MISALWQMPSFAADKVGFEHRIPSSTYVYFNVSNVDLLKEKFQQTTLAKMFKDSEFEPFLSQFSFEKNEKLKEYSDTLQENIGVSLAELLEIPSGEVGFAVFTPPRKDIAIAFIVDYGTHGDKVKSILTKVNEALIMDGQIAADFEAQETKITAFKATEEATDPYFMYFEKENQLVLSSSKAAIEAILERWNGTHERTFNKLPARATLTKALVNEGETPLVQWYINPIDLARVSTRNAGEAGAAIAMGMGFLPVLGFDQLKSFGGYLDFSTEKFEEIMRTQVVVESPLRGLMKLFIFPAADQSPPDWVPAIANSYSALKWDILEAYNAVEATVDNFQGPGAFEKLVDDLAKDPKSNGIHIKNDVIDLLTGQLYTYSIATEDESQPVKMTVAFPTTDPEKAKSLLEKITGLENFEGESLEIDGAFTIKLPELPEEVNQQLPVKFIAALKDMILVTSDEETVKQVIAGTFAPETRFNNSDIYKQIKLLLPEKMSNLKLDINSVDFIKIYYNQVRENGATDMIDAINVPEVSAFFESIDFKTLPAFEVLKKYTTTMATYWEPNEQGMKMNAFSIKK